MYRLLRSKNGRPYTLFHGIEGSRSIILDQLHTAEKKKVRDGSKGTLYISGFHVMETPEECAEYLNKFRYDSDIVIARIEVFGELRPKTHSRAKVLLADSMLLTIVDWHKAIVRSLV